MGEYGRIGLYLVVYGCIWLHMAAYRYLVDNCAKERVVNLDPLVLQHNLATFANQVNEQRI